jgi:hypothetical protein
MNWLNGTQGKMVAMLIGGLVFLALRKGAGVRNFSPPHPLNENAPDWAPLLTWALAAAVFAAIIAYFNFGPKIAGPVITTLIGAAIFVRLHFYS